MQKEKNWNYYKCKFLNLKKHVFHNGILELSFCHRKWLKYLAISTPSVKKKLDWRREREKKRANFHTPKSAHMFLISFPHICLLRLQYYTKRHNLIDQPPQMPLKNIFTRWSASLFFFKLFLYSLQREKRIFPRHLKRLVN